MVVFWLFADLCSYFAYMHLAVASLHLCVRFLKGTVVCVAAPRLPKSTELAMITAVTTEYVI